MGQPKLAKLPLLLIGHSQGGNFTYNYICWRPERVRAFAATKWIIPGSPKAASFQVPGILPREKMINRKNSVHHEGLHRSNRQHAKWAFLFEKGPDMI